MLATILGMEHFFTYFHGQPFTTYNNHKPLKKLEKDHTKTLNWLQGAVHTFNLYKKGSEMPAN
jgi:hypothetical protein